MTQPNGLASLNPSTGTVLYGRGQLGSIRLKTSRLSAISFIAVLILCCRQSWERLGELTFCKTMGVAVHSVSDIYSLVLTHSETRLRTRKGFGLLQMIHFFNF